MSTKVLVSLDGGGARALRTLQTLKYVEAQTGRRTYDIADMIAGTSTGGILALALANMTAAQAEEMYLDLCPKIFSRGAWQAIRTLGGIGGNKYDVAVLQDCLRKVFPKGYKIPSKSLVCATDTTTGAPVELTGVSNWDAYDAALATSAAPTYFDPHTGPDGHVYWDGGLINNNPSTTALGYLCKPEDALVLSVGTGTGKAGWPANEVTKLKPVEMISKVLSLCMDGSSLQSDSDMAHFVSDRYHRVQSEFAINDMDVADRKGLARMVVEGQQMLAINKRTVDAFISKLPR